MKFFDRLALFMEQKMLPPLGKVAQQRHINAIRYGMLKAVPFLVVGSVALIAAYPPLDVLARMVAPYQSLILLMFNVTFDIMGIWVAFSIAAALSERYELDPTPVGLTTIMGFILLAGDVGDGTIKTANLGGTGIFTAMILALLIPELFRLYQKTGLVIRMPDSVPTSIKKMFESFTATGTVLLLGWIIRGPLNLDVPNLLLNLLRPLVVASDSIWALMLATLLCTLLWSVGVHGNAVVFWGVLAPFLTNNIAENAAAFARNEPAPYIFTEPMFWFATLGGIGATLPLVFLCMRSKSAHLRTIGKVGLIPGLFTINEPVVFGLPIILNPFLVIPFILAPMVTGCITYLAMSVGLVGRTVVMPPWFTIPPPLNQWIATGGDIRAIIMVCINFVVAGIIWYPFFKMYEKKCIADEEETTDTAVE